MAVQQPSIDYTGRSVDLLIFQGAAAVGNQPITTGWGAAGELCTGVQKVAQTWLTLFLTEPGTVLNKPTRGSGFITAVRRGRIQVEADVPAEFALAAEQVWRTMDLDASVESWPTDERLDEATLEDFTLNKEASYLYLRIKILSVAGETRIVYLPVPTVIM